MTRAAGELRIPFTSGLLIGIGETMRERVDTLLAIAELHERYGHLQEAIVQNFRAKPELAGDHLRFVVRIAKKGIDPLGGPQAFGFEALQARFEGVGQPVEVYRGAERL